MKTNLGPADALAVQIRDEVAVLAAHSGIGISRILGGHVDWLTSQPVPASAHRCGRPGYLDAPFELRVGDEILSLQFHQMGTEGPTLRALKLVLENMARGLELDRQEGPLLREMGAAWESLEAVFEVAANLPASHGAGELLDLIMCRLRRLHNGLESALWVRQGSSLSLLASRHSTRGLYARALADGRRLVLNGRRALADVDGLESELANARSVIIAPFAHTDRLAGLLAVWTDIDGPPFDSHLARLIDSMAFQAGLSLQNERLRRTVLESERLRREVEIGSTIQRLLLCSDPPAGVEGLRFATMNVASRYVSGDFYDFVMHEDSVDVVVGDVMGKGIPAALVAAGVKNQLLRAYGMLGTSDGRGAIATPAEVMRVAHRLLYDELLRLESFVTLCLARMDRRARTMTLVDCGHTRTLHVRAATGTCHPIDGDDLPLGMRAADTYQQVSVEFETGDLFLFYSDGITEAHDDGGDFFTEGRLREYLRVHASEAPDTLLAGLKRAVIAFSGHTTPSDDLTCVAVQVVPLTLRPDHGSTPSRRRDGETAQCAC